MATVNFSLIGRQIYCDFTISRENKSRRRTGFTTNANQWKTKRSTRKNKEGKYNRITDLSSPSSADSKKVRQLLDALESNIISQFNEDFSKGINIDGHWLEKTIDRLTNQEIDDEQLFTYQIQKIIDEAPRRKIRSSGGRYRVGLSDGRIREINSFRNLVKRFEVEFLKGNKIKVSNIIPETIIDFENWLFDHDYSINYIGKMLGNFKSALNIIEPDFELNIDTSRDIKVVKEDKAAEDIIYLSLDELESIINLELPNNYLDNARKWLVLGCYVGQRASDLLELSSDKIKILQGRKVFQIQQKKTRTKVTIPILPEAERVISSGFPHKISQEKLREYFKDICKLAEINTPTNGRVKLTRNGITQKGVFPKWRLIGTHVCRRSFASNFYGKIPTAVLKGITGHSTETMFLRYIGKANEDFAMQMFDYMDKLPENKMRVIKNARKASGDDID